jgi:hypothetical protein
MADAVDATLLLLRTPPDDDDTLRATRPTSVGPGASM